jgi:hypothetical protein
MGKLYEDIVSRDATYREDNEKILSAYDKMLMNELAEKIFEAYNETTQLSEQKFAGWIAMYGGKKLEIKKGDAKDLYGAKQNALKHFKVPKSKQGLLAIEPAYESTQLSEGKWLDVAKQVVKKKQFVYVNPKTLKTTDDKKKGFIILDMTTANMLVQIADALGDVNREKFTSMPLIQAVDIGWKLVSK